MAAKSAISPSDHRGKPGSALLFAVLDFDPAIIGSLIGRVGPAPFEADRPEALAVLGGPLVRELHLWLLDGRHGAAIRALGVTDGHAQRIARAVAILRSPYAEPLPVDAFAEAAGMGLSNFHEHFRALTLLTPLQFQKQLRLIEARLRMLAHNEAVNDAAYGVGYESVSQYTREYGRMFGQPPARDIRQARAKVAA